MNHDFNKVFKTPKYTGVTLALLSMFVLACMMAVWNKLSVAEKEVGGIPNSSEDIKQAHAAAIEMYIQDHIGMKQDGTFGDMYFNKTLNEWTRFDITKRTKFDATISSGLAIMANNRHLYAPNAKIEKPKLNINIAKYTNSGSMSKIIKK